MYCEVANRTTFDHIRYAQCWEDADILLDALDIQPGDTCLSIASAGDNTMALLSKSPGRVVAIDLSAAQLACLELRAAAYRALRHNELLELLGSTPSTQRPDLYRRCLPYLGPTARLFWEQHPHLIKQGIGSAGRFERYLALFRRLVLPLTHTPGTLHRLLEQRTSAERDAFYTRHWDTARWRTLLRLFTSRQVLGALGRDPAFFAYASGEVGDHLMERLRYALTVQNPAENPYLQWIVTGRHTTALPYALRPENFEAIRDNLHRLEWHRVSLEEYLSTTVSNSVQRFNLSNVFEYMARDTAQHLLQKLATVAQPGARLAYWNMLVPRTGLGVAVQRGTELRRVRSLPGLSARLHAADKVFFYSRFIVEEVTAAIIPQYIDACTEVLI
ncbi:MAG: DUF3419 family protein [Chloroflexaceae bacterium]|nr:DUF3419 family protein [Chloroflexaceae bacterium]NJO05569.1 DUF3419 family protein [Chloroflexaceae bacterium]